jgi:hypothetical protein
MLGQLTLGLSTHSKCGRIRSQKLREVSLELLELAEQAVVLGVGDRRTVEVVVLVRRACEQNAQLRGAAMRLLVALVWRFLIVALTRGRLLLLFFLP